MNEKKYIIEVSHVNKNFKNNKVLKDVTLRCESGRIYGLVGHNGSGKTVLFKTICGFLSCDEGTVSVNGKVMGKDRPDKSYLHSVLNTVGLDSKLKRPVGKFSLGMRQRLALAQAIMEDPPILILDEPMNGLDKNGVAEIRELLLKMKNENRLIILASHNREDIEILCDEVYEMEDGILRKIVKE